MECAILSFMTRAVQFEQVGATIAGRYRVEHTLGRGGMAVVYRVRDERLNKLVALKRCWSREPTKQRRYETLLEREYHTLSQLAHPGIIEVYDYGVDPRGPYYTMELLEGENLEQLDRLPWQQACAVLRDVASSLAILHSRGLLHRDVSMRNVWCASGKPAKLIDFGAMMSMGVAKDAVGTPPFMAPEVLQMQALDARSDLFSLGALGFRLLTGRHAFPARSFADLRDAWRSKPQSPSVSVPEIPPELGALMLGLLTLDRAGRPRSAAEVIEKLSTIANLPLEDAEQISRAYLSTPILVGREAALLAMRRRMLGLVRGDGGLLLVQGVPGSGRSRLLDACTLEAKLLGATVVRADARDSGNGAWGVARALGAQLLALFPRQAEEAARLSHNVLGHVIDELRGEEQHTASGFAPERSLLVRELRDWILSLAKVQRLVVVVDDIERIDDPSLACLSALALKADRHPIVLALALEQGASGPTALRLLVELGQPIEVGHLQLPETEALVRSLFGEVANLPACAARIHRVSHGNPRAIMELAQHLVRTGGARYRAGSWVLPAKLDETDLPDDLAASLSARLRDLNPDARELAEVLALADLDTLRMSAYPALTRHRDAKRVFHALNELVAARILISEGDRYFFAQRGMLAVVVEGIAEARRSQLHVRIARMLAGGGGELLRRAQHLLAAGVDEEAIDLLIRADLATSQPSVPLLLTAIERAETLKLPAITLHRLRMALLINAPFALASASFRRVLPLALRQLEQDSGLVRYRALSSLPENERMAQALSQTQQAYAATPEHERVHTVIEAIRELARLSGSIAGMAAPIFDYDLLESLPDLTPLFSLSPSLAVTSQLIEGAKEITRGRHLRAKAIYTGILARIGEPDHAGLDDAQHSRMQLGLEYSLGLLEALWGIESCEKRAKLLDGNRALRVNAWRIRALYHLALGNAAEARKDAQRAALLQVQEGLLERYVNSTLGMELILHSRLGDLVAVKGLQDGLGELGSQHIGWRSIALHGRARYSELQGDLEGALASIVEALALAPPLRLPTYASIVGCHIQILLALKRNEEALERSTEYARICHELELPTIDLHLARAIALARAGEHARAERLITTVSTRAEQAGCAGLALGIMYETGARVAMAMGDRAGFDSYCERCAIEYEKSQNPAVSAKLTQLFDEAREVGVLPKPEVVLRAQSIAPPGGDGTFETIHSRIAECIDGADRGRCALTLLLQSTVSSVGYLYSATEGDRVELLASLPDPPADDGVADWLVNAIPNWVDISGMDDVTVSGPAETVSGSLDSDPNRYLDVDGRWLEAVPLLYGEDDSRCLVAVLVLPAIRNKVTSLPKSLTDTIAEELLERGDAVGWFGN
jgi:tetratricopeptide (TPR) repeat protein/predicted Ser/Thr protein kinase